MLRIFLYSSQQGLATFLIWHFLQCFEMCNYIPCSFLPCVVNDPTKRTHKGRMWGFELSFVSPLRDDSLNNVTYTMKDLHMLYKVFLALEGSLCFGLCDTIIVPVSSEMCKNGFFPVVCPVMQWTRGRKRVLAIGAF